MRIVKLFEEFINNEYGQGLHFNSGSSLSKYYTYGKKWSHDQNTISNLKIEDWDEKPSNKLLAKLEPELHSNKYSSTYKMIATKLGSNEKASKFLFELGVDGHKYKNRYETNYIIYDDSKLPQNESILGVDSLRDKILAQFPITIAEYNFLLNELCEHNVSICLMRLIVHKKREFNHTIAVANPDYGGDELKLRKAFTIDDKRSIKKAIKDDMLELRDVITILFNKETNEAEVLPLMSKLNKKLNHFGYCIIEKNDKNIKHYDLILSYTDTKVSID